MCCEVCDFHTYFILLQIIVTPLEDLSHYQECQIFDTEDEFEEIKERQNFSTSQADKKELSVIASQAEAFLKEDGNSKEFNHNFEKLLEFSDNLEDEFEGSAISYFLLIL